jgi:hypothetical protein
MSLFIPVLRFLIKWVNINRKRIMLRLRIFLKSQKLGSSIPVASRVSSISITRNFKRFQPLNSKYKNYLKVLKIFIIKI